MVGIFAQSYAERAKFRLVGAFIQIGLLIAVISAVTVSVYLFTASMRQLNETVARTDDLTWNITQLENEQKMLQLHASDLQLHPNEEHFTNFKRRFDVYFSRLKILEKGALVHFEPSKDIFQKTLQENNAFLQKYLPIIDGTDAEILSALVGFREDIDALNESTHADVLDITQLIYAKRDADRMELRSSFIGFAVGAFCLSALMLVVVLAFVMILARQRYQTKMMRRVEGNLQATFETSQDAVVVLDEDGKVLQHNKAASKVLGITDKSASESNFSKIIKDRISDPVIAAQIEAARKKNKPYFGDGRPWRVNCNRPDKTTVPLEIDIGLAHSAYGQRILIGFARDISERINREEILRSARNEALQGEQAKARFLAVMSHELRTPLNGIIAGVELLRETTQLTDRQKWLTGILDDCGATALEQVNNLLELTRLSTNETPPISNNPFDIRELVDKNLKQMCARATARGNILEFKVNCPSIPRLMGSEQLINHILSNLLSNAVKFTQSGNITVTVDGEPDDTGKRFDLILSVADTGIGIPKKDLARIFENFETLDGSYTRNNDGTGLGLDIVKRTADAMSGKISVQSTLGQGSVFTLAVNLQLSDGNTNATLDNDSPDHAVQTQTPKTILIAEDNNVNRLVLTELLNIEGHKIIEACDGQEAVELATKHASQLDVILMDVSMPRMDGLTATNIIKNQVATRHIPIIGVTAHALDDQVESFLSSGMDDVVIKPIRKETLLTALARAESKQITPKSDGEKSISPDVKTADIDLVTFAFLKETLTKDMIQSQIIQFVQDAYDTAKQLEHDIAAKDYDQAAQAAHKLAGSAAVLGAVKVLELLQNFERDIFRGEYENLHRIPALLQNTAVANASALKAQNNYSET